MCMGMYKCGCHWTPEKKIVTSRIGVTGSCELPSLSTGNQTSSLRDH